MRVRDWYFQGWERETDGSFRYTGEYYTLPQGKPKTAALCLGGGLTVIYLLTALFPSAGGMWRAAAIPQLMELIPLVYLIMGGVRLAAVKGPVTYRDWYASWRRMCAAALWSIVFTAAMLLAELAWLILADAPGIWAELWYLVRVLLCVGLSFSLYFYLKKNPCTRSASV